MIVQFPTGLYETVIPDSLDKSGNVTFTISNNPPPRTNLLFPKIPRGIVDRTKPIKVIDVITRRNSQGELIYTINSANRSKEGNNSKIFEIGQVLEFDNSATKTLEPMYVAKKSETRHDTNLFDYNKLGLTEEEIISINNASMITQADITDRLNTAIKARADAEIEVVTQQKIINDSTRNINALQVVIDNSGGDDIKIIYDKFVAIRSKAIVARDKATSDANKYASEAADLKSELDKIAMVVK